MISGFVIGVIFLLLVAGINCSNLGLISPIEVVEEWGCHDTEIRLTCGHLDSKLAILEATFTPNCTDEDCLKRLTVGLYTSKTVTTSTIATATSTTTTDPIIMETEAARKFLETLRQTHKNDDEITERDDDDDEGTISFSSSEIDKEQISGSNNEDTLKQDPLADTLISNKKKRTSLRTSLERLIERYLRKLSPNMNNDDCGDLVKRSIIRSKRSLVLKRDEQDIEQNQNQSHRTIIGARNITINKTVSYSNADDNSEMYRRIHESKTFCPEQRHRVSSLDRYHLEHSYKNESKQEINIRNTLNYRCSGRNHCSFIFALDHPYSNIWDSGIVRIKYICMEDFRINRYCNEHLPIDHEIDPKTSFIHPIRGEPVAEARIQLRDSNFHSLKILKSGDEDEPLPGFGSTYHHTSDSRKRKIKIETPVENVDKQQAQGVYSQDFKILKILPNNIDDFNDIERIGDQIYIRTDDDILNVPESELEEHQPKLMPAPTALVFPILPHVPSEHKNLITDKNSFPTMSSTIKLNNNLQVEDIPSVVPSTITDDHEKLISARNSSQDFSKFENITIIIREGEQYVVRFPSQPRIVDNLAVNVSTSFSSSASTSTKSTAPEVMPSVASESSITSNTKFSIFETDRRQEENTTMPFVHTVRDTAPAPTVSQIGLSDLSVEASNRNYKGDDGDNYDTSRLYDDSDDDDNEEDDDEFLEVDSDDIENEEKDKNRISYTSIQRVAYRRPLLHGFSMTPGYPKFYVGEWECKSVISAPMGQRIRITILDISLRYDEECKDFLRIVDLGFGQTLFNSCSEAAKPIEIVSISNEVEVIMKATSKFAFPKRGILIHYSALGCIDLPPPMNGHLMERNEKIAIYECNPSFVFPDTTVKRRQLICTERHTWDKILPDCIEELAVIGSGIISGLNLNSYRKIPSVQETTIYKSSINSILKMPTGPENQISNNNMKDTNMVTDVIVPIIIIGVLFIINGIVYYYIRLHRKRQSSQQMECRELAEL